MRLHLFALSLAFIVVSLSACDHAPTGIPIDAAKARGLLINRSWLDVMPRDKDTKLKVFRFVPGMGGGVFQDRTLYQGSFELFVFDANEREIRFKLPHTGDKHVARYTIERLPRDDRKNAFDLRLTLDGSPRGPSVYYSWSDERADSEANVLPPL